jgi:raffinose/stachyose/melibiose transport system permease protein
VVRDDATFSLRPASAREFLSRGPIALGFALLLNQKMHGQSLIRVLIFVPYVISEVIVRTGWSLMLQTNGAVNGLLRSIGLGWLTSDWLSNPNIAIWTLMLILTWKSSASP